MHHTLEVCLDVLHGASSKFLHDRSHLFPDSNALLAEFDGSLKTNIVLPESFVALTLISLYLALSYDGENNFFQDFILWSELAEKDFWQKVSKQ